MTTIGDIARLAGCSKVTVSRVLNDKPDVSQETRERVLGIVRDLRYTPDARARGLARRRSHILGLVMSDLTSTFIAQQIRGVERGARRKGYQLILCDSGDDPARERESLGLLRSHRVDGVVVQPCRIEAAHIAQLHEDGMPLVLLGRYLRNVELDVVMSDHHETARQTTALLARSARRRIAFLRRPGNTSTIVERLSGYRAALEEADLPYDPLLAPVVDESMAGGREAVQRLLRLPCPPDGIFAFNDMQAFGVLQGLAERGRRVPDDVAVVGADNLPGGEILPVPLTTSIMDGLTIGTRAVELLIRRIEKRSDGAPRRIMIPPKLIVRESCGSRRAGLVHDVATS
jgi:LacI family transcriptional regulator